MAPQCTSFMNCLIRPFLRGPRQMTGSSAFGSMNPAGAQAQGSNASTRAMAFKDHENSMCAMSRVQVADS